MPGQKWGPGLDDGNFQNRIRFESVFIRLCGIRTHRGINPLDDFLVGARGQNSHRVIFLSYTVELVARPRHLLNSLVLQEVI